MAFIAGDTIFLTAEFSHENTPVDVDNVEIKVYNPYKKLLATITTDSIVPTGTGIYEAVYTLPTLYSKVVQEWGCIYEGLPQKNREDIAVTWSEAEA